MPKSAVILYHIPIQKLFHRIPTRYIDNGALTVDSLREKQIADIVHARKTHKTHKHTHTHTHTHTEREKYVEEFSV